MLDGLHRILAIVELLKEPVNEKYRDKKLYVAIKNLNEDEVEKFYLMKNGEK